MKIKVFVSQNEYVLLALGQKIGSETIISIAENTGDTYVTLYNGADKESKSSYRVEWAANLPLKRFTALNKDGQPLTREEVYRIDR